MESKKQKTLLIITSSGGGGLLQAGIAKEQEAKAEDPNVRVIVKDVMKEWVWSWMGIFGIFAYNWTQKKGTIFLQTLLVNCQRAADLLSWPRIFFNVLRILMKEDVDRVVDTQPLGTKAIIYALRYFHKKRNKKIILEKIAVDLPTPSCQHFFRGVKTLSKKDKEYISFVTLEPLLQPGETEEEFWEKHCGLKKSQVVYEKYPIRQTFKRLMGSENNHLDCEILIRPSCEEESLLQKKIFAKSQSSFSQHPEGHLFKILPEDKVMIVLLGSNPSENAAFHYVAETMQQVVKNSFQKPLFLFVFCGKFETKLFQEITNFICQYTPFPKNLTIVPMSFQKDDVIAPLLSRSDLSITKSGGHTAMELMGVAQGKIWIHSEAKKTDSSPWTLQELLKGIASWEAGNAHYLKEKIGAEIVTPQRFGPLFEKVLIEDFSAS
jgi:hypothetical protein